MTSSQSKLKKFSAEKGKYWTRWKAHLCVSDITDMTLVGQEGEVCGGNGLLVEYEVVGYEVKGALG